MYNTQTLQAAFASHIGFFQPYDPAYPDISPLLTQSASGKYIQQVHPLLTIENLMNVAPEFRRYVYPAFEVGRKYIKGQMVTHEGTTWRVNVDFVTGVIPGAEGRNEWIKTDAFSSWLIAQYDAGTSQLFADLLRHKKLEEANRTLIDSLMLFDGMGRYSDRIIKRGRFCGLSWIVGRQEGLAIQLNELGMQLTGNQSLTFYLYHSSWAEPLQEVELSFERSGSFQWHKLEDVVAEYTSKFHNTGGRFYLGYYEEDLEGQAIKRDSSWGQAPCIGCSDWNYQSYQKWSKHVNIIGFHVDSTWHHGGDTGDRMMFDEKNVYFDASTNWGLNLKLSVACDLTEFFIRNKSRLTEALGMAVAVKLLEQIGYTTRINAIPDSIKALAFKDLSIADEDSFMNRYLNEIKAVAVDFQGISSDCMPCQNKKGIKMGAV